MSEKRDPVSRLSAIVGERAQLQDDIPGHLPGEVLTKRQKRAYALTTRPGGKRHQLILDAAECADRTERVRYITELMATGQWASSLVGELAACWGITRSGVNAYASEASRAVRGSLGSKEELRTTVMTFLERVAHEALEAGDNRSAVTAVRTFSEIAGLVSTRVEHTGADGGPIQLQLSAARALSGDALDVAILQAGAEIATRAAAAEARELDEGERRAVEAYQTAKARLEASAAPVIDVELLEE